MFTVSLLEMTKINSQRRKLKSPRILPCRDDTVNILVTNSSDILNTYIYIFSTKPQEEVDRCSAAPLQIPCASTSLKHTWPGPPQSSWTQGRGPVRESPVMWSCWCRDHILGIAGVAVKFPDPRLSIRGWNPDATTCHLRKGQCLASPAPASKRTCLVRLS